VKFLVDAPLPPSIAEFLRSRGHEASHVFERGWGRSSDKEILEAAGKEDAVVITADLDFPRLIAITPDKRSGLILFRGADWKLDAIRESLVRLFETISERRMASSIVVVEPSRIRVRDLNTE
jgi:predicted nuclease of predicted toxin-antitoxin system